MSSTPDSIPLVIVDLDTGSDDALALLMLLAADASREIKLLAITCASGNTSLRNVCYNTLRILKAANRLDIPVYAGAQGSLIGTGTTGDFHGSDGFGDLPRDDDLVVENYLQEENAVPALYRLVLANRGKVTLICLAPLTNIALALRTYPAFETSVKDLHIMGGNVRGLGNTPTTAEFNFFFDPEAAFIVLASAQCPVILTPWETCVDHPIPQKWRWESLGTQKGTAIDLLNQAEGAILPRHQRFEGYWLCCDQFVVANFLRPEVCVKSHTCRTTVEMNGALRGRMMQICDTDPPNIVVIDTLDLQKVKDLMLWASQRWTKL